MAKSYRIGRLGDKNVEVGPEPFEYLTGSVRVAIEDLFNQDPHVAIDAAVERMRYDLTNRWAADGHRLVAVGGE